MNKWSEQKNERRFISEVENVCGICGKRFLAKKKFIFLLTLYEVNEIVEWMCKNITHQNTSTHLHKKLFVDPIL